MCWRVVAKTRLAWLLKLLRLLSGCRDKMQESDNQRLRHIFLSMPAQAEKYKSEAACGEDKDIPRAVDESDIYLMSRVDDIQQKLNAAVSQQKRMDITTHLGATVQFIRMSLEGFSPDFLEYIKQLGFELYNLQVRNNQTVAVYFIPNGDLSPLVQDIQKYCSPDCDIGSGDYSEHALISSIDDIAIATLDSLWTDTCSLPCDLDILLWWEVWLSNTYGEDAINQFRLTAAAYDIEVASGVLSFPERSIIYIKTSRSVLENALSTLTTIAEIRSCHDKSMHLS